MTELELLARIIQCEAGGEGDNGMRAVATVVMNRVREFRGEYGRQNTINDVIFSPSQFECIFGRERNIYTVSPEPIHFEIADWAINGGVHSPVGDAFWFFNPYAEVCPYQFPSPVGTFRVRIGEHCFYSPTEQYIYT